MPKIYRDKSVVDKNKKLYTDFFHIIAKVVEVDDAGPLCDSDLPTGVQADLDTPTVKVGSHTVVPPYNKSASPETENLPSDGVFYQPPSSDEIAPKQVKSESDDEIENTEAYEKAISYISEEERKRVPDSDCAGKNKSFPIRNGKDVEDAARLVGHAPNPTSVKKRIIEIANRKGLSDHLPLSWKRPDQHHSNAYIETLALFNNLSDIDRKLLISKLEL